MKTIKYAYSKALKDKASKKRDEDPFEHPFFKKNKQFKGRTKVALNDELLKGKE